MKNQDLKSNKEIVLRPYSPTDWDEVRPLIQSDAEFLQNLPVPGGCHGTNFFTARLVDGGSLVGLIRVHGAYLSPSVFEMGTRTLTAPGYLLTGYLSKLQDLVHEHAIKHPADFQHPLGMENFLADYRRLYQAPIQTNGVEGKILH